MTDAVPGGCSVCGEEHLMVGDMVGDGRVIGVKHEGDPWVATRVMVRFGDPRRPSRIIGRSPFLATTRH